MKSKPAKEMGIRDPKKREALFKAFLFAMATVNVLIVIGFIIFIVFFLRK